MSRHDDPPRIAPMHRNPLFVPTMAVVGAGGLLIGLAMPRPGDRSEFRDGPQCCVHPPRCDHLPEVAGSPTAPRPAEAPPVRLTIEIPEGRGEATTLAVGDRPARADDPAAVAIATKAEGAVLPPPIPLPLPVFDPTVLLPVPSPEPFPTPTSAGDAGRPGPTADPAPAPVPVSELPELVDPDSILGLAGDVEVDVPADLGDATAGGGPTPIDRGDTMAGASAARTPGRDDSGDPTEATGSGRPDPPSTTDARPSPALAADDDRAPGRPHEPPASTTRPDRPSDAGLDRLGRGLIPELTPSPSPSPALDADRARFEARLAEVMGAGWASQATGAPVPEAGGSATMPDGRRLPDIAPRPTADPTTSAAPDLEPGGDAIGETMTKLAGKVLRPYGSRSMAPVLKGAASAAEASPVTPSESEMARLSSELLQPPASPPAPTDSTPAPSIGRERPLPDPSLASRRPFRPSTERPPAGDPEVVRAGSEGTGRWWWWWKRREP